MESHFSDSIKTGRSTQSRGQNIELDCQKEDCLLITDRGRQLRREETDSERWREKGSLWFKKEVNINMKLLLAVH